MPFLLTTLTAKPTLAADTCPVDMLAETRELERKWIRVKKSSVRVYSTQKTGKSK